ncbi:MAG TPA: EamA family transporter [Verrucomicrobiae bacterium]|nr:EamA family transporter [Verrucomicrobiae bacterium]
MQPTLVWLTPTLMALVLWGLGQGFVKKWISEVPPARFCLYFVAAKALVNIGYFLTQEHPPPFAPEGMRFLLVTVFAYVLDGLGWILYFESIVAGPIAIVGTLSAAYPALTVLFAGIFLREKLGAIQYVAVALVIIGCLGLSYAPPDPNAKATRKRWIPFAAAALILWAISQTIVKWSSELPNSNAGNQALFNTFGSMLTLGVYGLLKGRKGVHSVREWTKSFLPMGMLAAGDLGVIIGLARGPASLVSPISGAYPVVTLIFAALVLKERITLLQIVSVTLIVVGIVFSPGLPK